MKEQIDDEKKTPNLIHLVEPTSFMQTPQEIQNNSASFSGTNFIHANTSRNSEQLCILQWNQINVYKHLNKCRKYLHPSVKLNKFIQTPQQIQNKSASFSETNLIHTNISTNSEQIFILQGKKLHSYKHFNKC